MTRLSVNINKVALIRNARGNDFPNLVQFAKDCERFGAQGITVHPRPDQRHIRYDDIPKLREVVTTEFNIEGNPTREFVKLVLDNPPDQVTLVPDAPNALTSDAGWDTITHADFLRKVIQEFKKKNIRVSLFVDPSEELIQGAKDVGADRIEFYTGPYAFKFEDNKEMAVGEYARCSKFAAQIGIGQNAGHDLNLRNLSFFTSRMTDLLEVSIGHALVVDALYQGLHNTIQAYLNSLDV